MNKKIVYLVSVVCILFSLTFTVQADDEVKVTFNGNHLKFDVPPTIIDGRTMLPLRVIFEAFGASIEWNGDERKVKGTKGNIKIELQIDNKIAKVNGIDVELDVPGTIVDGRTLVPVRFISESLGANIEWLSESRTVAIKYIEKGAIENIDYNNPNKYLSTGKQTEISEKLFQEIDKQLNIKSKELTDIKKIYDWKNTDFKNVSAGGKLVGKSVVDEIIINKELTGCHDHGILAAALLRKYGFPVVMADATGIQFSRDYPDKTKVFSGHVFLEVYLKDKWILIDSVTGEYISDYDVNNPVIPIKKSIENTGYYVMLKGLDPDDYGVNELKQLTDKMINYSMLIKSNPSLIKVREYVIKKL